MKYGFCEGCMFGRYDKRDVVCRKCKRYKMATIKQLLKLENAELANVLSTLEKRSEKREKEGVKKLYRISYEITWQIITKQNDGADICLKSETRTNCFEGKDLYEALCVAKEYLKKYYTIGKTRVHFSLIGATELCESKYLEDAKFEDVISFWA